ncbi:MAG: hypothetical protein NC541_03695 [bacterium]|nr:hypothetical protein [bacterium]
MKEDGKKDRRSKGKEAVTRVIGEQEREFDRREIAMTDSEKLDQILKAMSALDGKVNALDEKVNALDGKVNALDEKVNALDGKVNALDGKVNALDEKVNTLDRKVNALGIELKEVKQKVVKTEVIVENEIRVNIMRVAEGHFDLSRKLNECIRISGEIKDKQEIQDIFINMHENRLKAL